MAAIPPAPQERERRRKAKRMLLIMEALRHASSPYSLVGWASMSEAGVQRAYATAVEPLLKEAAEKGEELWGN